MNSNYTRYHIELLNRSYGGWLVCTLLLLSLAYPFLFWVDTEQKGNEVGRLLYRWLSLIWGS